MATSDQLHEFYVRLLDDPEVPEDLQQRVFTYAQAVRNRKLLARLAAHPALTDELDEHFSQTDDALLVTAWMSRPGRDPAAIAARAAGERRVTVLAAIAQVEMLDAPTFKLLSDANHHRVATALLSNPAAPAEVLTAAAVTFTRHMSDKIAAGKVDSYNVGRKLEPLRVAAAAVPDVGAAIIGATDQPVLLEVGAASPVLSTDAADLACQKALEFQPPATISDPIAAYRLPGPREQVAVMAAALAGPGRDSRVETHAMAYAKVLERRLLAEDNALVRQLLSKLKAALKSKGMSSVVRTRIERACRFSQLDEREQDLLVEEAAAEGPEEVVRLLITSPQVTAQQTYQLAAATRTTSHGGQTQMLPWTAVATLLATRRNDPQAYGAILAARPGHITTAVLSQCVDPSAALLASIKSAAAADAPLHRNVLESPLLTMAMLYDAHAVVLSQDLPVETRKLVTALVASSLGDDEACWKTFEGLLANGFDGSVRMLLEVCEAFVSDTGDQAA